MILGYFTKILHKRAIKFAKDNLECINNSKMMISHGYENNKCHWNSYAESRILKDVVVVAVISVSGDDAMCHFINLDKKLGLYYDVTLGTGGLLYYDHYIVGECELKMKGIEDMDEKLGDLKHWIIERSFGHKLVVKSYKWLENKHNII